VVPAAGRVYRPSFLDAMRDQTLDESGSALVDRLGSCDPGIEQPHLRVLRRLVTARLR
jgi:RNA polymerase sigma-B factor